MKRCGEKHSSGVECQLPTWHPEVNPTHYHQIDDGRAYTITVWQTHAPNDHVIVLPTLR